MSVASTPEVLTRRSDAELMDSVRSGSLTELGLLFERHSKRVHALCYRLTGDADAADDLTQETFLRVRSGASSFRGDAHFTTWIYRLAYNATVDHLRRMRGVRSAVERMRRELETQEPSGPTPGDSTRGAIVEAAIAALRQDDRDIVVLTRYHDLRYEEVATIIGCSASAARVRAHRAMAQLRRLCLDMERRDYELRHGAPGDRRRANAEPD